MPTTIPLLADALIERLLDTSCGILPLCDLTPIERQYALLLARHGKVTFQRAEGRFSSPEAARRVLASQMILPGGEVVHYVALRGEE